MKHRLAPKFSVSLRWRERYGAGLRLIDASRKMTEFGFRVDLARCAEHERAAIDRAYVFTNLFLSLTGLSRAALGDAGMGQTDAAREWFRAQGAPEDVALDKRTKRPQFNAVALTCWAEDYRDASFSRPAAALLGLRKAFTFYSYVKRYREVAERHDGRLHLSFNPFGTKGERWSASSRFVWHDADGELRVRKINAQNVPKKEKDYDFGPGVGVLPLMTSARDCFVPDDGCVLVRCDYAGAEAALLAFVTGDEKLLEWVRTDADLHTENAILMFNPEAGIPRLPHGVKLSDKNCPSGKLLREAAKSLYALAYEAPSKREDNEYAETFKMWKQGAFPALTKPMFRRFVTRFFEGHAGIREWQRRMAADVERDGYVELPQTGRRLYVSDTARGRNMAQNFPFQSGIGALINRAIPDVAGAMEWRRGGSALLAMVHDELVFQCREEQLAMLCPLVVRTMAAPMDFGGAQEVVGTLPDVGPNWKDLTERKDLAG